MKNKLTQKQRIDNIRVALREKYGARKYRVTSFGLIHVYSQMPNGPETRWRLMGDLEQAEDRMGIERTYYTRPEECDQR